MQPSAQEICCRFKSGNEKIFHQTSLKKSHPIHYVATHKTICMYYLKKIV